EYKKARENRRAQFNGSYKYIFEVLSAVLGLDLTTVEEMILDAPSLEAFDSFFAKRGRKALKIFYQEGDIPGIECGRTIPDAAKGSKVMQLYVDKAPGKVVGLCLFFFRCENDSAISEKTIHESIFFGVLDATEGLLRGVKTLIEKVFLPAVLATSDWGALSDTKELIKAKQDFVEAINRYLSFLEGAATTIEGAVELKKIDYINFSEFQSFDKIISAAENSDTVHQLEEVLMIWYKQIEHVLLESKQIRREASDSGPLNELEHWKSISAKLNFIIEQIKGQNCRAVLDVLRFAHSKVLKTWRELDARITDAANESKDNVKYLRTLEKVCHPLYIPDVVSMTHRVRDLIKAIKMLHGVSKYYSTSEGITSLLIKVTNQMVMTCKTYITDSGFSQVWDQERSVITEKIENCMCLLKEYQKCFHEAKQEILEAVGEKAFEVSETYIFGKSEGFCRRLDKITEMIGVEKTFSALSLCAIEGIDIIAVKFKNIFHAFQKRQYDVLDPRNTEFDAAFVKFMTDVESLETQLQTFMRTCFGRNLSAQDSLQLLQRFQKLNMSCLQEETVHTVGRILQRYVAELEAIKQRYQSEKDDPPLARNMPPIAGRIQWVRQLFRRINEPIMFFHKNSNILASPEGKAVVQSYNKLAYTLVEFEVVYHNAWMKEMSQLGYPLQATIFVRHPKSEKFVVNFDPQILEIIRETKCMINLGLEVPERAVKIVITENKLNSNRCRIEDLLQRYEDLCQGTPNIFVNLLTTKMREVEEVFRQGLTMLTWSSPRLESFFQEADQVLCMFKEILREVSILSDVQIGAILKEISETALVVLPADGPTEVEDLLTRNEVYTKECAELLNLKSMNIEDAVQELIALFEKHSDLTDPKSLEDELSVREKHIAFVSKEKEKGKNGSESAPSEDIKVNEKEEEFKKNCSDLTAYFSHRLLLSLQKATRLSLASLTRRINVSKEPEEVTPFLKAEVHLDIPNLVIVPSLDDIQHKINHMNQLMLEVSRGVAQWGQRHLQRSILKPDPGTQQASSGLPGKRAKKGEKGTEDALIRKLKNFYAGVAEHEAITKLIVLLSSSMDPLKEGANEVLQYFEKYKVLWTEDKDAKIQEFFASSPTLSEIKEEILNYDMFEQEMASLNPIILLGPIELHTGPLKTALADKAKAWKMLLCHNLNEQYKKKLTDMMSFMRDYAKKLSQPLRDLDDVRLAMEALRIIRENKIEMDFSLRPIE
ncbi:DYH8 protein, partial [Grallaria varia]|nr:DYH8 protein [Grallaria varia]